jgi:hypothetical protein
MSIGNFWLVLNAKGGYNTGNIVVLRLEGEA